MVYRIWLWIKRLPSYWPNGGGTVSPFAWVEGPRRRLYVAKGARVYPWAWLHTERGGHITIGWATGIAPYTEINAQQGFVTIGKKCSINSFCVLYGAGGVTLGDGVRVGSHTVITSSNHNFEDINRPIYEQGSSPRPVVIEDDVWLGVGVRVLDGVRIGSGAVIGAGAVVTKDIPPRAIAVGVPAKVIRYRGEQLISGEFGEIRSKTAGAR